MIRLKHTKLKFEDINNLNTSISLPFYKTSLNLVLILV